MTIKNKTNGFTIAELLTILGVFSVLCCIAIPSAIHINNTINTSGCVKNQLILKDEIISYMIGEDDGCQHYGWEPGEYNPISHEWDTWPVYERNPFIYFDQIKIEDVEMTPGEYFLQYAYNGEEIPSTCDDCHIGIRLVETKLVKEYDNKLQDDLLGISDDDIKTALILKNHNELYKDYQIKKTNVNSSYVPEGYIEIYCTNPEHDTKHYRVPINIHKGPYSSIN